MKKLILIPLFVLIVLLTCCSKVIPEAKDPLFFDFEAKEKEMLDLDMYSLENNPAEYAQTSYQWGWASKGDIGYYHEGGGLMRVFNPKLQMSIAVCNKPNCKHDDPSCVARGYDYDTGINLSPQTYYKGYVYCIGRNRATSYATLYRIAGDGSTREAFMQLFKYDPAAQEFHYPHFVISQDAMYYVDEREEQKCLRRCPFEEKTQEIICTTAETSEDIYRLKLYGDFLFFKHQ